MPFGISQAKLLSPPHSSIVTLCRHRHLDPCERCKEGWLPGTSTKYLPHIHTHFWNHPEASIKLANWELPSYIALGNKIEFFCPQLFISSSSIHHQPTTLLKNRHLFMDESLFVYDYYSAWVCNFCPKLLFAILATLCGRVLQLVWKHHFLGISNTTFETFKWGNLLVGFFGKKFPLLLPK